MMKLTGKQKKHLKALGHHLEPLVRIGKQGLGEVQYEAIRQALFDHELIKVKIIRGVELKIKDIISDIEVYAACTCVQSIGKTALFYAANPDDPKIELPKTKK